MDRWQVTDVWMGPSDKKVGKKSTDQMREVDGERSRWLDNEQSKSKKRCGNSKRKKQNYLAAP